MTQLLFFNLGTMEILLVIPIALFTIYSLFHAATNMAIPVLHRLIWGLVVLSIPLLGSIAYWVVGRKPGG